MIIFICCSLVCTLTGDKVEVLYINRFYWLVHQTEMTKLYTNQEIYSKQNISLRILLFVRIAFIQFTSKNVINSRH